MTDAPWHEDPAFWETLEGLLFPPERLEAAGEELSALCSLADVDAPARVLDVPCGVGRYAVEFADRGFDVTGVDATAAYLESARERAVEAGVDVEFVERDMREFRRSEAFDLVVNAYTSFGYFEDRADDRLPYDIPGFESALERYYANRRWNDDGTVPDAVVEGTP